MQRDVAAFGGSARLLCRLTGCSFCLCCLAACSPTLTTTQVWEETIIFMPPTSRMVFLRCSSRPASLRAARRPAPGSCLAACMRMAQTTSSAPPFNRPRRRPRPLSLPGRSATLPNAFQFAQWVSYIHTQPVHVVYTGALCLHAFSLGPPARACWAPLAVFVGSSGLQLACLWLIRRPSPLPSLAPCRLPPHAARPLRLPLGRRWPVPGACAVHAVHDVLAAAHAVPVGLASLASVQLPTLLLVLCLKTSTAGG